MNYPNSDNDITSPNSRNTRRDITSSAHRNVVSSRSQNTSHVREPGCQREEAISDQDEEMYAAYKQRLIKVIQANFVRFRSPGPKRVTELVMRTIPEITNWDTRSGYLLRNSALKAFDNMRADFMRETREIAENVDKQIIV